MPVSPAAPSPGDGSVRRHRHDLDGLRGLAILLVALYHVFAGRVSGGVDVFLTLSGFFLVLSVTSRGARVTDPRFRATARSIGSALLRIGRRLLPAAVVTLAGVLVAGRLFLPKQQWEEAARQALASLFYVENWHLIANETDYEAAGLAVSPMQHFWSLSVQGQFFLVIPVLVLTFLWILRRIRPTADPRVPLLVLLGSMAAASFGFALVLVEQAQQVAYYHTLARGWEILAGGLLALCLPWLTRAAVAVGETIRVVVGLLALLAIVTCGFLIDGGSLFPGWMTWWPVGATLLLIWAGSEPTRFGADRLLATRPARWLGDHAYSLYLWHWPVLIIYLEYRGQQGLAWPGGSAVLATSLILAVVTKRLIEDPMREPFIRSLRAPSSRTHRLRISAAVVACLSASVLTVGGAQAYIADVERMQGLLTSTELYPSPDHIGALALSDALAAGHIGEAPILPPTLLARGDRPPQQKEACVARKSFDVPTPCVFHEEPGAPRVRAPVIALVGGSHASQLLPAIRHVAEARGVTVVGYISLGCPWGGKWAPGETGYEVDEERGCVRYSELLTQQLLDLQPDLVITTATRPGQPIGSGGDRVPSSYLSVWEQAVAGGLELVLIRDNPWRSEDIPLCVERHLDGGVALVNRECGVERSLVLTDPAPTIDLPGSHWIDLSDLYCRKDYCNVVEGNMLIYRDRHHVTATYARTLAPEIDRQLGNVTGWWSGPLPAEG
ncbi:acyltransferase family protein [Nocardioides limicola]|uniref:acyltransferase family protein n=1 Tax=Nocardioides limicola TaxID=2803368 RepID=UPI00193B42B6|nr:acyltransferase family protein [Nocardioides sp. DJM-14]